MIPTQLHHVCIHFFYDISKVAFINKVAFTCLSSFLQQQNIQLYLLTKSKPFCAYYLYLIVIVLWSVNIIVYNCNDDSIEATTKTNACYTRIPVPKLSLVQLTVYGVLHNRDCYYEQYTRHEYYYNIVKVVGIEIISSVNLCIKFLSWVN